jgi:hypothetical protein
MARDNLFRKDFQQGQAVVKFKNTTNLSVPPYAAMIITSFIDDEDTGEPIAQVRQCTNDDEKMQLPSSLLFNQHFPIPASGTGWGSQSIPCYTMLGGPALSPPSEPGGDAVPTTNEYEPVLFDHVGPMAGSWQLWPGGLTHTIQQITINKTKRYAVVTESQSFGALIEHPAFPAMPSTSVVTPVQCKVWMIRKKSGKETFMVSKGISSRAVAVNVWHVGRKPVSAGKGQAKLCGNKWLLDVSYC